MLELTYQFDDTVNTPKYIQLYNYIKKEIQSGHIPSHTRLPSIRSLSEQLGVNKITIESAYDQLISEGYLESRPKSGYFVQAIDTHFFKRLTEAYSDLDDSVRLETQHYDIDFNDNKIDEDHFPLSVWRKITAKVLNDCPDYVFQHGSTQGDAGLRHELKTYLHHSRGVNCSEDQIIIGANSQYLMMLLLHIIGMKKGTVGMEEPGYHLMAKVFEDAGYTLEPVPLEADGLNVSVVKDMDPDLVFVSPSHQYPLGMTLPIQKRISLLEWARQSGAYIIEDDILSELRYSGTTIPSLQGLDPAGQVIYMGTFFKSLLPSLRVGYMVLPKVLIQRYSESFYLYQQTASLIHQKTIELFMKEGHWDRHLLRMRKVYRKKRDRMVDAIQAYMGSKARVLGEKTGLHVVVQLNDARDENELVRIAANHSINVSGTSHMWYDPANNLFEQPTFIIGFGGIREQEINSGIKALSEAWFN
ncbi:PLP-dependent aminotransferase family protein [Salipaludibacillus aurantiacus]|uniref:GntR family transcriptional regulator / MocR family aminotransferase n=1 Tax=Salipaludibacillus aurantiacus TaxID=1601833 RepID=A0A1H9QEF4_9BACI|nr:PLP-dependent aminotransferase family protein [Salipaludibacillus aurantiacus]SER58808.1 GntR family transcriptional regulator / MocR family aminotransferase [Salipaludibacillus aurantiacus]